MAAGFLRPGSGVVAVVGAWLATIPWVGMRALKQAWIKVSSLRMVGLASGERLPAWRACLTFLEGDW
jgi:hypothetical protein